MGSFERRAEERWPKQVPVRLVMWNKWGEPIFEDTVTVNVSCRGVAVRSTLPLIEGRFLQVIKPWETGSFVATVRARTPVNENQPALLHLQFVNQERPFEVSRGS